MLALCENIRRLRRARGLSQEELAGRLGVSRQSVSLWEQGETNPTVENIYAMADVLEVSFDELMAPHTDETGAPTAETKPDAPAAGETVTARSFDELMASAEEATAAPRPAASFSNTPTPTHEPTPAEPSPVPDERAIRAEAQYYRYRRLITGVWVGAGILLGSLLLFVFAVAGLGDYATTHPDSVVNNVIGPSLMLVSILLFPSGLATLIVMSVRAGRHRRRMGDLFDLATYEEMKRGGRDYAAKRK